MIGMRMTVELRAVSDWLSLCNILWWTICTQQKINMAPKMVRKKEISKTWSLTIWKNFLAEQPQFCMLLFLFFAMFLRKKICRKGKQEWRNSRRGLRVGQAFELFQCHTQLTRNTISNQVHFRVKALNMACCHFWIVSVEPSVVSFRSENRSLTEWPLGMKRDCHNSQNLQINTLIHIFFNYEEIMGEHKKKTVSIIS